MNRPPGLVDLAALSELAPELAAAVVSVAGDIALVIDPHGVIRNVALAPNPAAPGAGEWVGRRWVDTVTGETRQKIEQLLQEVQASGVTQRREVNHPFPGLELPIAYAAVRLGEHGPVLAVGRDLRAIAAIQQRFVESQQEMERDYWQRRQAESRYRMLFQVATDAVLVVDGLTMNVVEANRAASKLFGLPMPSLLGQPVSAAIAAASRPAVEELLSTARATGRPAEMRARIAGSATSIDISAAPFRAESALLLLVRARAVEAAADSSQATRQLADFVERTPDAVVITDASGRVIVANPALFELFQLGGEVPMQGRALGEWVGDAGRSMQAILTLVRCHGIASQVGTAVRGSRGREVEVELSAALLDEGEQERIGFTIRQLDGRSASGLLQAGEVASAIEALARDGRLALPDLVQAAAQLTERHLIKSALARSRGDRAAAATLLGIDAESLEPLLRRHGMPDGDDGSPPALN